MIVCIGHVNSQIYMIILNNLQEKKNNFEMPLVHLITGQKFFFIKKIVLAKRELVKNNLVVRTFS